jgi:hypothetical protein
MDPMRRRDVIDHRLHPEPRAGQPEPGRSADSGRLEPLEPEVADEVISEGRPDGEIAEELVDALARGVDRRVDRDRVQGEDSRLDPGTNRPKCGRLGIYFGQAPKSRVTIETPSDHYEFQGPEFGRR